MHKKGTGFHPSDPDWTRGRAIAVAEAEAIVRRSKPRRVWMNIEMSQETKDAILSVAGQILPDMEYEDAREADLVAEMVLDASRLLMFGFPAAMGEVHGLIHKHGWAAVHSHVASIVPTA